MEAPPVEQVHGHTDATIVDKTHGPVKYTELQRELHEFHHWHTWVYHLNSANGEQQGLYNNEIIWKLPQGKQPNFETKEVVYLRIRTAHIPSSWNAIELTETAFSLQNTVDLSTVTVQLPYGTPSLTEIVDSLNDSTQFTGAGYIAQYNATTETVTIQNVSNAFVINSTSNSRAVAALGFSAGQSSVFVTPVNILVGGIPDLVRYPFLFITSNNLRVNGLLSDGTDEYKRNVLASIDTFQKPPYSQVSHGQGPILRFEHHPHRLQGVHLAVVGPDGEPINLQGKPWHVELEILDEKALVHAVA